jgi:hypothetical protein
MERVEEKRMTRDGLVEHLREKLIAAYEEAEWYRDSHCTHLFELCTVKRRAYWDMVSMIEKAESKAALLEQIHEELRNGEIAESYERKGFYISCGVCLYAL